MAKKKVLIMGASGLIGGLVLNPNPPKEGVGLAS